ncbi:MAG: alpha/beta hydrolase [Caulobacteraceae bacterium]
MGPLYVLSFRDLKAGHGGAVLPGALFEVSDVSNGFDWTTPAFSDRWRQQPGLRWLREQERLELLQGKDVWFVTHGFNVNRDNGFKSLGAAAQELRGLGVNYPAPAADVLVIPVLWPGDWIIPVVTYPWELHDARKTGEMFANFLLDGWCDIARASFISHSLGARVVLETVQQTVSKAGPGARPDFDAAVLMAPAADDTVFDDPQYAQAVAALQRLIVLSSVKDKVLGVAYVLGDPIEAALWRGEHASTHALGLKGPRLKKDSPARPKTEWYPIPTAPAPLHGSNDHGDYLPAPGGPPTDGWTPKRLDALAFCHGVLAANLPQPAWLMRNTSIPEAG